jgi:hypothetical protein
LACLPDVCFADKEAVVRGDPPRLALRTHAHATDRAGGGRSTIGACGTELWSRLIILVASYFKGHRIRSSGYAYRQGVLEQAHLAGSEVKVFTEFGTQALDIAIVDGAIYHLFATGKPFLPFLLHVCILEDCLGTAAKANGRILSMGVEEEIGAHADG